MVTINKTFALAASEGDQRKATGKIAVLHSTATPNAPAKNLAQYEKRTYNNAYVHFGVDDAGAYQVGTPGYVAWGAGAKVNSLSPLQIELCEFTDKTRALKAYKNYINLARQYAKIYGIPFTLDDGTMKGFKTHNWVSHNLGGTDHTDPYSYLSSIGISKAQFAKDLANGVGNSPVASKPKPVAKPTPAKPAPSGIKWFPQNGSFSITTPSGIKLRSGSASTKSPLIAVLPKGSVVKYNAYGYAGGYV